MALWWLFSRFWSLWGSSSLGFKLLLRCSGYQRQVFAWKYLFFSTSKSLSSKTSNSAFGQARWLKCIFKMSLSAVHGWQFPFDGLETDKKIVARGTLRQSCPDWNDDIQILQLSLWAAHILMNTSEWLRGFNIPHEMQALKPSRTIAFAMLSKQLHASSFNGESLFMYRTWYVYAIAHAVALEQRSFFLSRYQSSLINSSA